MRNNSMKLAAVATVAALVVVAGPVAAEMVTFGFSGTVTGVSDPNGLFDGSIVVGGAFSGTYSFESTTPDAQPDNAGLGDYVMATPLPPMVISVGSYSFAGGTSRILIEDGRPGRDKDSMSIVGTALADLGLVSTSCGMGFADGTATAFSSDELPLTPPLVEGFDLWHLLGFLAVSPGNVEASFAGLIDSLVLIPEPTTLALALIGWPLCYRRLRRPCS